MENYAELNLPKKLESLYMEIYRRSYLWNSLHDGDFIPAKVINLQIISCIAKLFGGDIDKIHRFIISNSQSIMTATRSYLNYGMEVKQLSRNQCVILAPDTVHVSLTKASEAYRFQLILMPTINGSLNDNVLQLYVKKYQNKLVALFCLIPSFSYGNLDNI